MFWHGFLQSGYRPHAILDSHILVGVTCRFGQLPAERHGGIRAAAMFAHGCMCFRHGFDPGASPSLPRPVPGEVAYGCSGVVGHVLNMDPSTRRVMPSQMPNMARSHAHFSSHVGWSSWRHATKLQNRAQLSIMLHSSCSRISQHASPAALKHRRCHPAGAKT